MVSSVTSTLAVVVEPPELVATAVMELAEEYEVDVPITAQVRAVCHEGLSASEAYDGLMGRQSGVEHPAYE